MKRTVMAIIEVEDSVNNGQVLDTFEKSLDQSNCNIENAITLDKDSDSAHERYLNYLMSWIADHHEETFKGCSPACLDEWLDNEGEEDEEDIEYDVALGCNEDDYVLASNGNIKIKKSLVYKSFCEVGKELRVWFVDEDDPLRTYRVVEVTDDEVIAEFID